VLFGSAAEGRLRATSDVNLVFVLSKLDMTAVDRWRAPLQSSAAAIDLQPMILLASELTDAADAFAVKFADISARHRVLHGPDPFASLTISREARVRRLRQVLLNLALRLRHALLLFNEAGQTRAIVDALGPLRVSAMILLELEGSSADSPRTALDRIVAQLGESWVALIASVRPLREQGIAVDARAQQTLHSLAELADLLFLRSKKL
jgi:biotin operon repressor